MSASAPDPALARTIAENDRAMRRALIIAIIAGLAADAVLCLVLLATLGGTAAQAAVIGAALSLVVTLPTLATAHFGARYGPAAMAGVVMGGWLVKMIVLIALVIWVRSIDGIALPWVGAGLLVGAVAAAVVEAVLLRRSRPRIEVRSDSGNA